MRQKRQATLDEPTGADRLEQPSGSQPTHRATEQELAAFNQTISQHESRMQLMMRQIMSSPYMPTRDQMIQLATTVLTLLLMMLLGPAVGAQAGLIQTLVRQFVPLLVAATVHYAADSAVPMKPLQAPITNAQIAPVQVQPSAMGQAF